MTDKWDAPTMGGEGHAKCDCKRIVRCKDMQYVEPLGWGVTYCCDGCKEKLIKQHEISYTDYMAALGCPQEILDKY